MKKKHSLPEWYPLPIYKKKDLTAEDWLQEIYKRIILKRKLENESLNQDERENIFHSIIIKNEVDDVLGAVRPILPRPFKPISLTEVLIMAFQILNSDKFKALNDKNEFETALMTFVRDGKDAMTMQQKEMLYIGKEIPWHAFTCEEPKVKWLPEHHPFFYGIPLSYNPAFRTEDSVSELRRLNHFWQKPKTRPLSKKVFKNWEEKKILELFDLTLWFQIKKNPLKPMELAKILWPNSLPSKQIDSSIRPIDLLKEAQKACKKATSDSTLQTLYAACESRAAQRPQKQTA